MGLALLCFSLAWGGPTTWTEEGDPPTEDPAAPDEPVPEAAPEADSEPEPTQEGDPEPDDSLSTTESAPMEVETPSPEVEPTPLMETVPEETAPDETAPNHEESSEDPPNEDAAEDSEGAKDKKDEKRKKHKHRRHKVLPVPVLKIEPSVGFITGVRGRYVYREEEDLLNRITLDAVVRFSFTGVQQHEMRLRMRDLLGKNEIFDVNFRFDFDPTFTYVGLANNAKFTNEQLEREPLYRATRLSVAPDLNFEFVIADFQKDQWPGSTYAALRGLIGWNWAYDDFRAAPDSLLAQEMPEALGRGTRADIYLGLNWDSRNNDWNPTAGGNYDVSVAAGGPWAGAPRLWGRFNASFRNYFSLGTPKVVLAHALLTEIQWGDLPLVALGEFSGLVFRDGVGGLDTGRGFVRRRFIGKNKVFTTAEFRIAPFKGYIGPISLEPGIKPFVDLAWVQHDPAPFLDGLHVSGGVGFFLVWDEFEVLRIDTAFSPEGFQLLMAADHAF